MLRIKEFASVVVNNNHMSVEELYDVIRIDPDNFRRKIYSLNEFENLLETYPSLGFNSFQRTYAALRMFGKEKSNKSWKPDRWKFLDDRVEAPWKRGGATKPFEIYLYGVEEAAHSIMKYLEEGSVRRDAQGRICLLIGPPSSGKTDLINLISYTLDAYSTLPHGEVYTVRFNLEDYSKYFGGLEKILCPSRDKPLSFYERDKANQIVERINKNLKPEERWKKLNVEFTRCPSCRYVINTLQNNGVDDWRDLIEVVNLRPGEEVVTFEFRHTDEKAYDSKRIFGGDINLDRFNIFLDKNHPLVLNYGIGGRINGPSPQRHIVHFSELLKARELGLLDQILDLITSRNLKVNETWDVQLDCVIFATTNLEEYGKVVTSPKLAEYFTTRTKRVEMGYLTVIDDLAEALKKRVFSSLTRENGIHVPPHYVERFLAPMAVMATLDDPSSDFKITILQKALIYNGEVPYGIERKVDELYKELITAAKSHPMHELSEGIKNGIPFRFFQDLPAKFIEYLEKIPKDQIEDLLDERFYGCLSLIDPLPFFDFIIRSYDGITTDTRRRLVDMRAPTERKEPISLALNEAYDKLYTEAIVRDVNKALVGEKTIINIGVRYLSQVYEYKLGRSSYFDPITGKQTRIDENFLKDIEKFSRVVNPEKFREQMANYVIYRLTEKKSYSENRKSEMESLVEQLIDQNPTFRQAIERYAIEKILPDLSKASDISTLYSAANENVMKELYKMGYCKSCASYALRVAGKLREKK